MRFEVASVRLMLLVVVVCAGCRDKDSTEGAPSALPAAPAGLVFSIPRGELAFFRPSDGALLASYMLTDWPATSAAINAQGNRLVIADGSHSRVGVLTLPGLQELATKALGGVPVDMQISSNASHAYVITHNSNLWDYLTASDLVDTLEVGVEPRRIVLRPPFGLEAWIACPGDCTLYIVDLPQFQAVDTLHYGMRPTSVAFTLDGATAYVALCASSGIIQAINADNRTELNTRQAGTGPFDLAMSDDGRFLAAADSGGGRVRLWDLDTGDRQDLPVSGPAGRIRFSRTAGAFFVCVPERNCVLKVGLTGDTPTITDTIHVAPDLHALTLWEPY